MSERDRFDDEANAWLERLSLESNDEGQRTVWTVYDTGDAQTQLAALLRRIDAEAYARGRDAGIEEAARECELVDAEADIGAKGGIALECARSIRALKTGGSDGE